MRCVARATDVQTSVAPPTTGTFGEGPTSATGTWTAAVPTLEPHASVRSDGQNLLAAVTCQFAFVGKLNSDPSTPVAGTVTLRLEPAPTTLRVGGVAVLADTDKIEDRFHNVVRIVSSARLRTG